MNQKYASLRSLMALDKDPNVKRVIIELDPHPDVFPVIRGILMAIQYVNQSPYIRHILI